MVTGTRLRRYRPRVFEYACFAGIPKVNLGPFLRYCADVKWATCEPLWMGSACCWEFTGFVGSWMESDLKSSRKVSIYTWGFRTYGE